MRIDIVPSTNSHAVIENPHSALYNLGRKSLPDAAPNPVPAPNPRRWSIVAAGLLLLALALVVIYTSRSAFFSPLALVVVAAIGLAALLLQLRLRKDEDSDPRSVLRSGSTYWGWSSLLPPYSPTSCISAPTCC